MPNRNYTRIECGHTTTQPQYSCPICHPDKVDKEIADEHHDPGANAHWNEEETVSHETQLADPSNYGNTEIPEWVQKELNDWDKILDRANQIADDLIKRIEESRKTNNQKK
jgi:phosphoglycerate-specific signal transduction histidine kinase